MGVGPEIKRGRNIIWTKGMCRVKKKINLPEVERKLKHSTVHSF